MANPVFTNNEAFAPRRQQGLTGQGYPQGYAQQGYPQQGYAQADPYAQGYGQANRAGAWTPPTGQQAQGQPAAYGVPAYQFPQAQDPPKDVMTIDDVLTKAAILLGAVAAVAVLSWKFLGHNLEILLPAALVCGLASFIIPMVAAFRRSMGPVPALIYAVLEGVFLGGLSGLFELYYPGIVVQAVLGTLMATGVTLAAFHFGKVRLSGKVQQILFISLTAYAGVALLNFVLYLFGIDLGLIAPMTGKVGLLAWGFALLGVVLAVVSLIDDFQFIEAGVQAGAPRKTSWVAAFGLTVTLVFLYVKILRILSYIRR
jgi:uncharacterized YccA/Bax inhibitor family protein